MAGATLRPYDGACDLQHHRLRHGALRGKISRRDDKIIQIYPRHREKGVYVDAGGRGSCRNKLYIYKYQVKTNIVTANFALSYKFAIE